MKLWMRFGFACMIEEEEEEARQYHLALLQRKRLSIRTRNKLRCINLNNPEESTWHTLYTSGLTDAGREGFVNVTGFDRPSFDDLLVHFDRFYQVDSGPGKRGRPRKLMDKSTVLGLILSFYIGIYVYPDTYIRYYVSQDPMPDLLPSSRTLQQAECALFDTLRSYHLARIRWPSCTQQKKWGDIIHRKANLVCIPSYMLTT
jgi:hypothetical protein